MKKYLLPALIALFCLGSISCKKNNKAEPVPEPPVVKYTYANSRIKELRKGENLLTAFIYDNTNKLTQAIDYGLKNNPDGTKTEVIVRFKDYIYNANGKILGIVLTESSNPAHPAKNTYDYTYSNDILQSYTYSSLNTANPTVPVKTLINSYSYTYHANGQIKEVIIKDAGDNLVQINTFSYANIGLDPQVNVDLEPVLGSAYSSNFLYYANIIDPNPLLLPGVPVNSPFIEKSFQLSSNAAFSYQTTYIPDTNGKIKSYTMTYSNKPELTATYTYVYEAKK